MLLLLLDRVAEPEVAVEPEAEKSREVAAVPLAVWSDNGLELTSKVVRSLEDL